ncbi:MAG: type III pantothenate kinase [Clostridiaceae bacterium]|nr:type III pantothenate kinase [Clostridiales bacterium]MDD6876668.1 type III pantothenate kinase [Clostridiaceae bacterium]MDY3070728.1 type III pantothenate kinase [Eubacteriales bacterium]MDY3286087.1 type III pantothenate kinase [Eubacteriales bacterium]MDY5014460.1 type III pantothenate kinase [Eubacteriales bacterium]
MVLTVDVGNTNIVLAAYEADQMLFTSRIQTEPDKTADQYAIAFNSILHLNHVSEEGFEGAIISSVVPPLQTTLKTAVAKLLGCRVLTIGPGIRTGLNIKIDNPAILGADLVCGAVAALKKYKPPIIIFDLGTATKISAIDKFSSFVGCSISPGIGISLHALSTRTAQLPHIDFDTAQNVIGTNTIDSMRSGIVFGTASMIDGMAQKYRSILGEEATVVATGGFSQVITPYCETNILLDPTLVPDGLYCVYRRNTDK